MWEKGQYKMIKYVSRNKDEAVVMTIIHIGKRGERAQHRMKV